MSRRVSPFAITAAALLVAACDSTAPRGPGSIFVSSSATNPEPGASFYQYEIVINNGSPRIANVFETISYIVNGLAPGAHEVRLNGIPSSCNAGANPRSVTLRGDDTALVVFNIVCQRTTGDLQINVTTTGPDPDPNGYLLMLGTTASFFLPTNAQTTLPFFPPGTYTLSLTDLAPNCTYGGPQSVTVTAGGLATVSFVVTCTPVAVIKVNTTTGTNADVDGYIMTVGSGTPARVAATGTSHVRVPNGSNTWQLRDIQPNCTVSGSTTGTVDVAAGDTATIDLSVDCAALGYGTAGTVATEAAGDTLANSSGSAAGAHDLVQLTTRYDPGWLILVMHFARPVGTIGSGQGLFGVVDLDVDESSSTGAAPLINGFGGSAQQGSDNRLDLFSTATESVVLLTALLTDTLTHRVPFAIEGDSVIVRIPLEKLKGDDGRLSISAVFGTQDRPTDIAPNAGVILARPTTSLLADRNPILLRFGDAPLARPLASWPPASDFRRH